MRWEQVVHDDEMDFPAIWNFYPMKTVELRKQSIGIVLDMVIVILEYPTQEFVFAVMDCLDDILVVAREVEETPTLAGRSEFG